MFCTAEVFKDIYLIYYCRVAVYPYTGGRNSVWDPSAVPNHSPELLRSSGWQPGDVSWNPNEQQSWEAAKEFLSHPCSLEIPTGMAATHSELGVLGRWGETGRKREIRCFLSKNGDICTESERCISVLLERWGTDRPFSRSVISAVPHKFRHFWEPHVCETEGPPC